ncbi:outer membrane protein [Bartonella sp. DGB2]|uniref:outer membrane protein n=1 Tax=Bartonella sp. DGB2 TaxID=3388426 RepID=UPI00398FDBBD
MLMFVSDEYQYLHDYRRPHLKRILKDIKELVGRFNNTDAEKAALEDYLLGSIFGDQDTDGAPTPAVFTVKRNTTTSFEQQWSGATRARFGFAVDRFMPYLAGGIAYTSVNVKIANNDTATVARNSKADGTKDPIPLPDSVKNTKYTATKKLNDSQILLGFTVGAGFDFAITDNVLARAEYRYNDFGSKDFTFKTNEVKYALKDQDIRVGIAFKF